VWESGIIKENLTVGGLKTCGINTEDSIVTYDVWLSWFRNSSDELYCTPWSL